MDTEDGATGLRVASFSCYLKNPQESFVQKIGGSFEDPFSSRVSPPDQTSYSLGSSGRIKTSIGNISSTSDNLVDLRVSSFSSYLKTPDENFVFKVAGPVKDPTSAFVFPQDIQTAYPTLQFEKNNKSKEGEISIFGADKYFNMKLDYNEIKHGNSEAGRQVDSPRLKQKFGYGTPSVSSEASSWKSQNALLPNIRRQESQTRHRKALGSRFFASFGCQGPCSDSKAVHVSPTMINGAKHSQTGYNKGDQLPLPILHSGTESLSVKVNLEKEKLEEARRSLEVFGSSKLMKKGDVALNLERKLSMLTWDAIPKPQSTNPPTTTISSSTVCDDLASDASSDLFEIENISTGTGSYQMLTKEASDYVSGCLSPTTLYAPSEASIEWSVVTASAADYSSVISDYDMNMAADHPFSRNGISSAAKAKNNGLVKEAAQKGRPGGFLGCKSQKAVSVSEAVIRTPEKSKHQGRDFLV